MKHNLITYFKAFYSLGLQTTFKADQQAIYWALLSKFNSMLYPDKLRISNKELFGLTNIPLRTLYRHREIWNTYRHLDTLESWIIKYESGQTREYGIYEMNFTLLNGLMPECNEYGINDVDNGQTANGLMPKNVPNSEKMKFSEEKGATNLQIGIKNGTPSYTRLDKKDKIRIGSVDEQSLNDKDDSEPIFSTNEKAIINAINRKCATSWDGGMGTPNYAILQEIATYSIVVVQQGIDRLRPEQKPPGMLSYLRKVIINGLDDGSISDDFQPAMKDPYKENPYLYARDRFYSMMSRDQLDWEGFQKDGKLRYMASASLGFVETARDALKDEQLLGEVIEKHPIMLEVLADIEKTAQEVYDAEPR